MQQHYDWAWVEAQVAQTIDTWNGLAEQPAHEGRRYGLREQQEREKAYDHALRIVEYEARKAPRTQAERLGMQTRVVEALARFSANALDLDDEAIELLTEDFLPAGTQLARWARRFDTNLSLAAITQACRNAWTACGLQALLNQPVKITPAILGYSLLYPYSDNYLDGEDTSSEAKLRFCERVRERLRGEVCAPDDDRETALWTLVRLIENQYPRAIYPQVFDCLLAIHRAQQESLAQLNPCVRSDAHEVLRMSCAKGGSSVLADACLVHGWLSAEESRFAFQWGVLLQLGDDLQDLHEDMHRGSITLFSRAAALGRPLDSLVMQLLHFSEHTSDCMDCLPHGDAKLKALLRMSWRSLIVMAMAESHTFFSPGFLAEAEQSSPFRFAFLRARRERLSGRQGLYTRLFEAFLAAENPVGGALALPQDQSTPLARSLP